jgi:NDP-sugar pyrophosphorylase family protein
VIDGVNLGDGIYEIKNMVEKPKEKDAPSRLVAVGIYILTPEVFKLLVKNLDKEKVTNEELSGRLDDVNKQFQRKIALQLAEAEQVRIIQDIIDNRRQQADVEKRIADNQFENDAQRRVANNILNQLKGQENELQKESVAIIEERSLLIFYFE